MEKNFVPWADRAPWEFEDSEKNLSEEHEIQEKASNEVYYLKTPNNTERISDSVSGFMKEANSIRVTEHLYLEKFINESEDEDYIPYTIEYRYDAGDMYYTDLACFIDSLPDLVELDKKLTRKFHG